MKPIFNAQRVIYMNILPIRKRMLKMKLKVQKLGQLLQENCWQNVYLKIF